MILKIDNLKDLETKKIKLDKNLMSICVFGNEVGKYYDLLTSIHQTCKKNNIYLVISTVEESLNAVTSKFDKTDDLFFVSYSEKDLIKFPKLLRYLTPFFFNTNQFHYRDSDSLLIKKDIEIFEKHDFYKPHYEVLSKLDLSKCDALAPQLTNCISAHLIRIGYHSGGSIGWLGSYYIYGIFESNKEKYIVPLKVFTNRNYALNEIKN